jgi:hypothetical protein
VKLKTQSSIYSGHAAFIVLCVREATFVTNACFKKDSVPEVFRRFYNFEVGNLRSCSNILNFVESLRQHERVIDDRPKYIPCWENE